VETLHEGEWVALLGSVDEHERITRARLADSTPIDRLRALEAMRAAAYDDADAPPRLSRVHRFASVTNSLSMSARSPCTAQRCM